MVSYTSAEVIPIQLTFITIIYSTVFVYESVKTIVKTKCIYDISRGYNCDKCNLSPYYRGCMINHMHEICRNKYFIEI